MVHSISRTILLAILVAAAAVYAADEPRCNASARECDQQIRQMLSGRRFLGATIAELEPGPGLVVKAVKDHSPADRAGMRVGDRLIAVNDKSLVQATTKEFKQILADARSTGKLRLIVWRAGTYKKLDARLEPYTKEQIDKIVGAHLAQSHTSTAGAQ